MSDGRDPTSAHRQQQHAELLAWWPPVGQDWFDWLLDEDDARPPVLAVIDGLALDEDDG